MENHCWELVPSPVHSASSFQCDAGGGCLCFHWMPPKRLRCLRRRVSRHFQVSSVASPPWPCRGECLPCGVSSSNLSPPPHTGVYLGLPPLEPRQAPHGPQPPLPPSPLRGPLTQIAGCPFLPQQPRCVGLGGGGGGGEAPQSAAESGGVSPGLLQT